ncbi:MULTISPECIES: phytanoyl-CoA dioxygenase family protein [Aliagarivorans]|uniref:phytanoyl-CoA dioxygenase family protein n=1 Tax=Aliagarivorans TaxID=882379 RepID=UPI000429F0FF|nr:MULTISPECIES: phytanoyl-CoA dioxygenase family protein [Aliagarivorans]
MDLERLSQQFWQQGYLLIEDFFPQQLMDQANQAITEYFDVDPAFWHNDEFLEKAKTEVIPWFPQNDNHQLFDQIEQFPAFSDITQQILGDEWENLYCMVMFSKAGTRGQAWHQDCAPEIVHQFNLNRLIYTEDIKPEVGGEVVIVPGSHRLGLLPAGDPEAAMEQQLVLRPRKGSLILLHGHTWHRVLPIHQGYRFSTNYRAIPKGTPQDITDVCVYRNMRYHFGLNQVIEERKI